MMQVTVVVRLYFLFLVPLKVFLSAFVVDAAL